MAMNSDLLDAARLAQRWISTEGNAGWEDIADWFYRDTGHLRPGKSMPDECSFDEHDRDEAWSKWCKDKKAEVREQLAAAIAREQQTKESETV